MIHLRFRKLVIIKNLQGAGWLYLYLHLHIIINFEVAFQKNRPEITYLHLFTWCLSLSQVGAKTAHKTVPLWCFCSRVFRNVFSIEDLSTRPVAVATLAITFCTRRKGLQFFYTNEDLNTVSFLLNKPVCTV